MRPRPWPVASMHERAPASTKPTAGPRSGAHYTPSAPIVFKEPTAHWACDTWSAVASTRAA